MKLIESKELNALLPKGLTPGIFTDTLKFNNIPINMGWMRIDKLDRLNDQVIRWGWDPETALVLYVNPPDYNPEKDISTQIAYDEVNKLEGLHKLNHTQCTCMFFENMTVEKLIGIFSQVMNMKAFL